MDPLRVDQNWLPQVVFSLSTPPLTVGAGLLPQPSVYVQPCCSGNVPRLASYVVGAADKHVVKTAMIPRTVVNFMCSDSSGWFPLKQQVGASGLHTAAS